MHCSLLRSRSPVGNSPRGSERPDGFRPSVGEATAQMIDPALLSHLRDAVLEFECPLEVQPGLARDPHPVARDRTP